jgi:predicted ATPase
VFDTTQNIYYAPLNDAVRKRYEQRFLEFLPSPLVGATDVANPSSGAKSDTSASVDGRVRPSSLLVYGHTLQVPTQVAGRRTARFTFASLCGQAYGPADFIELARMYSVIFLSDIPRMDMSNRNEVRAVRACSNRFYGQCCDGVLHYLVC